MVNKLTSSGNGGVLKQVEKQFPVEMVVSVYTVNNVNRYLNTPVEVKGLFSCYFGLFLTLPSQPVKIPLIRAKRGHAIYIFIIH